MNFDESIAYGKNVSALIDFCKNMDTSLLPTYNQYAVSKEYTEEYYKADEKEERNRIYDV